MEIKNYFAQDAQGNIMPSANCYLYLPDTTTLATGLIDGNGVPISNPFLASSVGQVEFGAPNGVYDLRVALGSRDWTIKVQCADIVQAMDVMDSILGSHAENPAVRNNGQPLQPGDETWNSTDKQPYWWDGSSWLALNSSSKQLESELSSSQGGTKVFAKRTVEPNAQVFSIAKYHENRPLNAEVDFGVSFSGMSDQTSAFSLMVSDIAGIAADRGGPCPSVSLPYGKLRIDGNIELYPFMRFHSEGPLDLYVGGNNGASFWIRNDLAFPQGFEADYNMGPVFNGSNGMIRVLGDGAAGSVAFKFGNAPGMAVSGKYSAFCGLRDMHIRNLDRLIQFTNNNVFANRFENLKMSNAVSFAVSNMANTVVNSGELINFSGCFINNCEGGIETNGEIEIRYSGGSISFTKKPVRMNGNHLAILHLDGAHLEKFGTTDDYALIQSTATSNLVKPTVNLSGYILPSSYPGVLPQGNVLRTMIKGKLSLNVGPLNIHSDTQGINGTEFQSLCDSEVSIRGVANAKVGGSTNAVLSTISRIPDPQVSAISRYTAGSNTTLAQVTGGAPARTALKLTSIGAQRSAQTDYFPVVSGEIIFGSAIADISSATAGAKLNMRFNWFYSDKTSAGSTAFLSSDLTGLTDPSGWKNVYQGTGRQSVPAGCAFARLEFATDGAFAGDMLLTSFMVGNS